MLTTALQTVAFACAIIGHPVASRSLEDLPSESIFDKVASFIDSLGLGTNDTTTFTISPECVVPKQIDAEAVRSVLSLFVESLPDPATDESKTKGTQMSHAYHPDPASQDLEWHMCTIVSQCLDPEFMLSLHDMSAKSRAFAYKALSRAMSQESFNMLQLQQHSNLLLGEMQDWATTCAGECYELNDENGLLNPVVHGNNPSTKLDVDYDTCANFRTVDQRFTYWRCFDEPRFFAQGNIDNTTGNYFLGDIFNEPHIHGRNLEYDYFAVYGDMNENGGAFGFRFSGHHMDVNFQWDDAGKLVRDMPVFLGHNPLIVPETTPPLTREPDERADVIEQGDHYLIWQNMAGVGQFSEAVDVVVDVANELLKSAPGSYLPLENWASTGHFGSFMLAEGDIEDYDYVDMSKIDSTAFEKLWAMIKYTLKFARGHGATDYERDVFRSEGKALWTSYKPQDGGLPDEVDEGLPLTEEDLRSNLNFIYFLVETNEWIYYVLANQLFVVVSETEPSNHLHSMLMQKKFLNCDRACCNGSADAVCAPLEEDDGSHHR